MTARCRIWAKATRTQALAVLESLWKTRDVVQKEDGRFMETMERDDETGEDR